VLQRRFFNEKHHRTEADKCKSMIQVRYLVTSFIRRASRVNSQIVGAVRTGGWLDLDLVRRRWLIDSCCCPEPTFVDIPVL